MKYQLNYLFEKGIGKWIFFATTLFLVGYFIFPTNKMHNLFLRAGLSVPVVLMIPFVFKRIRLSNWVVVSTVFLAAYLFLNSLWSIHYSLDQTLEYLVYLVSLYCLIGGICFVQYKQPDYSEHLFKAFIVIGSFHYVYGIWAHFDAYPDPLDVRYTNRPIDEAIFAGMLLLACFWLFIEQQKLLHKIIIVVLSIPFIVVLLLAKSRGPQLAFLVSLPFLAYFQGMRVKNFMILGIALFSILVGVLFMTDTVKQVFSRGLEFPYRMEIWKISLREGFEYFWFGQGMSEEAPIYVDGFKFNHSHNILLSVFRMGGIVGVLLFLINFILCLAVGFKQKNSITKLWVVWLLFGVLSLMTNGRYPLTRHTSLWFAYWIPIAFIAATTPYFKIGSSKNIRNDNFSN